MGKIQKTFLNHQFILIHKLQHIFIANKPNIPQFVFNFVMEISNTCMDKQLNSSESYNHRNIKK